MSGSLFVRVTLAVGILAAGALAPAVPQAAPVDPPVLLERWAAVYPDAMTAVRPECLDSHSLEDPLYFEEYCVAPAARAQAMTVSPDGTRVYVTGGESFSREYDTVAYDAATGAQLWSALYAYPSGAGCYDESACGSIAVSHDGAKVYVAGPTMTIAYDASTGAELWVAPHGADELAVGPDGTRVYTTGGRGGGTVAYDAATGALLWASWGGWDLAVSPDGAWVYVSGGSGARALDAGSGTQSWVANGSTVHSDVQVSPDGARVYVTGGSYGYPEDFTTIAYDAATGAQLWMAQYPDASYPWGHRVDVSPDGARVYVTGASYDGSNTVYTTLGYVSTTGARLWVAHHKGPDIQSFQIAGTENYPVDQAVSPDGTRIYVTGGSSGTTYATVVYDATDGAELSVAQQSGFGQAIAVSPDGGRVYVTGRGTHDPVFGGSVLYEDHVTFAYCTSALTLSTCLAGM